MIAAALLSTVWSLSMWAEMPPRPDQLIAPADPDEVVVNGARIRRLKLQVRRDGKPPVLSCRLKRPSGDDVLDAAVCAGAVECTVGKLREAALLACLRPKLTAIVTARRAGQPIPAATPLPPPPEIR